MLNTRDAMPPSRLTALILALLVASVFVISRPSSSEARSWPESCPQLTGTFMQPLAVHATWTQSDWRALMAEMQAVGVRTLYLQWTQLDEFNIFVEGTRMDLEDPMIVRILDAAEAPLWNRHCAATAHYIRPRPASSTATTT